MPDFEVPNFGVPNNWFTVGLIGLSGTSLRISSLISLEIISAAEEHSPRRVMLQVEHGYFLLEGSSFLTVPKDEENTGDGADASASTTLEQ